MSRSSEYSLAKGTTTKKGKNESVTVDVLVGICNALDCDVLEIIAHKERSTQWKDQ